MTLIEKLDEIEELINDEFENEKCDIEVLQKLARTVYYYKTVPHSLIVGTPLQIFEMMIEEAMAERNLEYKLEFVAMPATCDGDCFEPHYCLCWYDNGIHTKVFVFTTSY